MCSHINIIMYVHVSHVVLTEDKPKDYYLHVNEVAVCFVGKRDVIVMIIIIDYVLGYIPWLGQYLMNNISL